MKSKLLLSCLSLFVAMSCQDNIDEPQSTSAQAKKTILDTDAIALQVVDLLNEQHVSPAIISTLKQNRIGISLGKVLMDMKSRGFKSKAILALDGIVKQSENALKGEELPDKIEIPEMWMYTPKGNFNSKDILVAYPPVEGDEKDWDQIKAYTLNKRVVYLDAKEEPKVPVVVVETNGHESFLLQVGYMNKMLNKSGLQKNKASLAPSAKTKAKGLDTSILKKVYLKNDEEPWIKGGAEIYAITTGIRNSNNEPEIEIIPMEYLNDDNIMYMPNQVLLYWDKYQYQAANILFYEKDSNYNYKQLTSIIVAGVFDIVGTLTAEPWVVALGKVTSAIVEVMPDDWYTDTDDYVDALYTIEKTKKYYNYKGAASNIGVDIEPYFIPVN